MRRALVTGAAGFTGRFLTAELSARGYAVVGFDRVGPADVLGELGNRTALRAALADPPDVVFHLAGQLKASAEELYTANVLGTVALFDMLGELGQRPLVLIASSSAVYGAATTAAPIGEDIDPRPVTHYGASKLAQEVVARRAFDGQQIPIVIARAFNLLGPGLSSNLACGAFADRIASAEITGAPLTTGNLSASRDFTDVRDVVRAYVEMIEYGKPGTVYNVCSQRAVSLRSCVELLLANASRPIELTRDPALVQSNDIDTQIGDGSRLAAFGWSPSISLEKSLSDMLEDSRRRAKGTP